MMVDLLTPSLWNNYTSNPFSATAGCITEVDHYTKAETGKLNTLSS